MSIKTIAEVIKEYPKVTLFVNSKGTKYIKSSDSLRAYPYDNGGVEHFISFQDYHHVAIVGLVPYYPQLHKDECTCGDSTEDTKLESLAEQIRTYQKENSIHNKFSSKETGLNFRVSLNLIAISNLESNQSIIITMVEAAYLMLPPISVVRNW